MKVDPEKFIFSALEKVPKLDGIDGPMLMFDLYESNYGIYNHLQPAILKNKPLASVAMHPGEDFTEGSALTDAVRVYIENNIGDYTKMSLVDFLELTSDVASIIVDQCQAASKRKSAIASQVEKDMKDL
jgi:hypothetical protein